MTQEKDKNASRDNCEICRGARGGVPGNENIINGRRVCDYCHAAAPGGYTDEQEQPSVHPIAPCGQVPSAASEETPRPVAGAAPTEQERPLDDAAQAIEQCRAVAHMARTLASVHEARALILQRMEDPPIEIIGESSAEIMEWLGDALSNMDAVDTEDSWIDPVFERAHVRWPIQSHGRGGSTGQSLPSEAALAARSYGARPDHPCTAANVTAQAADDAAKDYVLAGWRAALRCHALHGMAGWSMYGEEFRGAALRASQQGESRE